MWKKIGVKNEVQTNVPTKVESPKSGSFTRVRPLDQRPFVEKDNSFSKNSMNSSKISAEKSNSNQIDAGFRLPKTPKLFISEPSDDNFLVPQQVYTPKSNCPRRNNETKMSHGSLPRYYPTTPLSNESGRPPRMSDNFAEASAGVYTSPLLETQQYPFQAKHNDDQALQEYVQKLQKKLQESEHLNKFYARQLKELKSFVLATRKDINKEVTVYKNAIFYAIQNLPKITETKDEGARIANHNSDEPATPKIQLYPPAEEEAEYRQELENVMLKIEDLRQDVQNTAAFKQEIFKRIDSNLKRIENMKNNRKALLKR